MPAGCPLSVQILWPQSAPPPTADGARHEGILLYPQAGEPLRADIRLEGFRIQARTVDLGREWQLIHGEMLEVIGG